MADVINSTQTLVYKAYDYYLWTLSLSGRYSFYFIWNELDIQTFSFTFDNFFTDKRTRGWFLVDSPIPTLIFTAIYLYLVWLGPKLMAKRKPFQLKWVLLPYNLSMAALNLYIAVQVKSILLHFALTKRFIIFYRKPLVDGSNLDALFLQLLTASTRLRYSYICEPCRQRYHPDELQIADAVWWYYFSKLLEFCDTFFFILRKKDSQLSFLHVYHHSTMFGLWWIGIKWVPSGSSKYQAKYSW